VHHIDYTELFEDSLNEIYMFSADTLRFLEVNRGARENLGYSMDELRTLTPLDLKKEFTPRSFEDLVAPLQGGCCEQITFETTHCRKDGTFYPVEVHLHLSEIGGKSVFVAIILDITERKRGEENALQLALEKERVRLLHEFIGDISHDLRTPLTQAGTSLYLLGRHTQDADQHHYIQRVQDALARMERMIDSMLQMNKLDQNATFDMDLVALNSLLETIVQANQSVADEQRVSLVYAPTLDPNFLVYVDTEYLTRALENIITNAIKYTPAGGTVTLETIFVADYAEIMIRDTGTGIPADDLPHIFERFYRGDDTRNTTEGSNGMGLAIAYKVIDKHGGTIEVESTVGVGTTFYVRLPLVKPGLRLPTENAARCGVRFSE
jgi:PAS domain S-box-containing protein